MKKVAVVILNWNGEKLLKQFLPAVITHTPSEVADIIVADNGSTDGSIQLLKEQFPSVDIIALDENYGFAEGYNQALQHINHEITVLLNSDIEVTPGWLDQPIVTFNQHAGIAAIQPKILDYKDKRYFEYAGAAGGYIDKYGYPFCRGRVFDQVEQDKGQYDTPAEILWASGACLFIRTEVYKKEGGLDGRFFSHQEEIDLCWRLRSRGYRVVCIPDSIVYHVGGATLDASNPRKTLLNFRNNLLMLYKNLPEKDLKKVMRIRFWLDRMAAVQSILTGHPKNAKAILEGRRQFNKMKASYAQTREENLRLTIVDDIEQVKKTPLLMDYYLKGKKHYSEL